MCMYVNSSATEGWTFTSGRLEEKGRCKDGRCGMWQRRSGTSCGEFAVRESWFPRISHGCATRRLYSDDDGARKVKVRPVRLFWMALPKAHIKFNDSVHVLITIHKWGVAGQLLKRCWTV